MSTITRIRSSVKPTVMFDATERHPAPRSFGRGVLASKPTFKAPASFEDMAWAAQTFNVVASAEDRYFDDLARAAAMQARLDRGHVL